MRASSKRPRIESFGVAAPPLSSTSDTIDKAFIDPTTVAVPPPSTSNDSCIHCMLETVMTVEAAHGQLLVDMLDELHSLRADLESLRQSPPFDEL